MTVEDREASGGSRGRMPAVPLEAAEGYRLWAADYDRESALTAIERAGVDALTPRPTRTTRLLDAGCGTGRRLEEIGPAAPTGLRVGIDLVPEMLWEARRRGRSGALAAADILALPCGSACFDLLWCRLALGHLPALETAYAELARVARPGATLVVTDFHPRAADAGFARTFRAPDGSLRALRHFRHDVEQHRRAAGRAGLQLDSVDDLVVGPAALACYEEAGAAARYHEQLGLPMVLLLRFSSA